MSEPRLVWRNAKSDAFACLFAMLGEAAVAGVGALGMTTSSLLMHGMVCLLLAWGVLHRKQKGGDIRIMALLAVSTAFCGVFGACGSLLCLLLASRFGQRARPFEEWYESLFPQHREEEFAGPLEAARAALSEEDASPVTPLIDILEMGDEMSKQSVVALVTRSFRPAFAPVLRRALDDSSNSVRVQAATALAKIEGGFLKRAMELSRLHQRTPDDSSVMLSLARHYDDYAFTGLLDPAREQENQQQALVWYRRFLEKAPADAGARQSVLRLLVRQGRFPQAAEWIAAGPRETGEPVQAAVWRLETAFRMGQWDRLRALSEQYCLAVEEDETLPPQLRQAVALWMEANA